MFGSRWVLAAAVAGSIAVIACGGGSSKKNDKTPAASGSTPGANATAASGSTAQATSSGGGSGDPDIQAIGKKFAKSTFNATYKVSGADTAQFSDGKLVLEKDGDKNFRMEVTTKQDGVDTAIIFIETADVQAFCLKDAGTLGALLGIEAGKGVCFPTSAADGTNPVSSLRSSLNDFENANVDVLEKTSRSIAGQDSKCFKTKDKDTSEITTSCFAGDGALLYVKTEGDNASEIEAQSISKKVSADDFKLPYEKRDLPTGAGSDSTP
jgi:hypothetical protein